MRKNCKSRGSALPFNRSFIIADAADAFCRIAHLLQDPGRPSAPRPAKAIEIQRLVLGQRRMRDAGKRFVDRARNMAALKLICLPDVDQKRSRSSFVFFDSLIDVAK